MVDFHMHVLPSMDDGSKNTDMSLAMLEASAGQGIGTVCATSHFYASENTPAQFLNRRAEACERLMEAAGDREDLPEIRLGAEVYYFGGISAIDDLDQLCLEGTSLLLLEMPFVRWTDRMLHEVQAIRSRGLQPVAAHIERYLHIQPKKIMENFFDLGVYIQCNAEFFLSHRTARHALNMLRQGRVQFLGSDAHNLSSRAPKLGEALMFIERKLGREAVYQMEDGAAYLLNEYGGSYQR